MILAASACTQKRTHDNSDGSKCQKCQRELCNENRHAGNYDESHCDPRNMTKWAALFQSAHKRRLHDAHLENTKWDILRHRMRK